MTAEYQASDRLKDILQRARERSAGAAPSPAAQDRARAEASVESLLDRNQPLPDPRALSRLYQEETLTSRLPGDAEAESGTAPGPPPAAPQWSELPAPAPRSGPGGAGDTPPQPGLAAVEVEPDATGAQPAMSPAEIRRVMKKLQADFGGTYTLYEIPQAPGDDFGGRTVRQERELELAELKRLADESAQSNWIFLLGAAVVLVILGVFIYLAAAGPLRVNPAPVVTPSATAPAAHH